MFYDHMTRSHENGKWYNGVIIEICFIGDIRLFYFTSKFGQFMLLSCLFVLNNWVHTSIKDQNAYIVTTHRLSTIEWGYSDLIQYDVQYNWSLLR